MKDKKSLCGEFATAIAKTLLLLQVFLHKLSDFKMDVIKWQLNFVFCNFGLKSYLCNFHYKLTQTVQIANVRD